MIPTMLGTLDCKQIVQEWQGPQSSESSKGPQDN